MLDIVLQLYRPMLRSSVAEFARYGSASIPASPKKLPFPTKPLRGIKMILFDVYGTLLHSQSGEIAIHSLGSLMDSSAALRQAHIALLLQMIEKRHYRVRTAEQLAQLLVEITVALQKYIADVHQKSRAKGVEVPEVDIRRIWQSFLRDNETAIAVKRAGINYGYLNIMQIALCYEMLVNPVSEMPGALATLQALSPKLPLGIVSNAQFYTPLLMESLWKKRLKEIGFQPSLSSWSYRLGCAKPAVAMFKHLLRRVHRNWNIVPSQILYLGNDLLNDMWTAREVGLQCCLFAGDNHSLRLREDDPRCRNFIPESCIGSLKELPALLNNNTNI